MGERWGYGLTVGGPVFDLSAYDVDGFHYGMMSYPVLRFKDRMFFFWEAVVKGLAQDQHHHEMGVQLGMEAGVGVFRRYKDFGAGLLYGFGWKGWDGDGVYERLGLDAWPRVIVCWIL